jgi:hypothetical protein
MGQEFAIKLAVCGTFGDLETVFEKRHLKNGI